jgi:hypothetical protein
LNPTPVPVPSPRGIPKLKAGERLPLRGCNQIIVGGLIRRSAFFSEISACGGNGGLANRPTMPSYPFLPPPSDQNEEQARFECMRLVRAGAISDAELLRLRDQALSWCAVLDWTNGGPSRRNE